MASDLILGGGVTMLLIRVTAVLALSLLWAGVLGRASASTRYLVWLTALSLLAAVPILSTAVPPLRVVPVPASMVGAGSGPAAAEGALGGEAVIVSGGAVRGAEPSATIGGVGGSARPGWYDGRSLLGGVLALWAAGSVLLLVRLGGSAYALRRALRASTPLSGSGWTTPLCEAADRLELNELPDLVLSRQAAMPFACGFRRPAIVLPPAAVGWDADRRRAVLFHELAHIRRRDLVGHTVARVVCALYWVHPLVWIAARRLRAESERACDDLALSVGIRPSEYADHLLQIVSGVRRGGTPAVALPFAQRRELEGRVLAILDPVLRRGRPTRANLGAVAALLLCGVAFSAVGPAPAQIAGPAASTGAEAGPPSPDAPAGPEAPGSAPASSPEPGSSPEPTADLAHEEGVTTEHAWADEPAWAEQLEGWVESTVETTVSSWVGGLLGAPVPTPESLPLVLETLTADPSAEVRTAAAWSLARFPAADAHPALARALRSDSDPGVREMAAWALGSLGRDAAAALPALASALRDPSAEVRERAAWAIGSIEPRSAPTDLYRATLHDPEAPVRLVTAWALARIGDPAAADALLTRIPLEHDPEVVEAIHRALLFTAGPTSEVVASFLASPDPHLRARGVQLAAGGRGDPWPWPWPEPRPMP